jgi:hypothetical protein
MRRKANSTILSKQRPKKRRAFLSTFKSTAKNPFIYIPTILAGTYTLAAYLNVYEHIHNFMQHNKVIAKKQSIQLSVTPQLNAKDHAFIHANLNQINEYKPEVLETRMKKVQSYLSAESISLIKTSAIDYHLNINFHNPILRVDLGKVRFINEKGHVFGEVTTGLAENLPILKGLTLEDKIQIKSDQTYNLDPFNEKVMQEALLLASDSLSYNINCDEIIFDPYRGFQVKLKAKRISIELGRAPFSKKLSRLQKILQDLNEKNTRSAHIEVDYEGKAFIQELDT